MAPAKRTGSERRQGISDQELMIAIRLIRSGEEKDVVLKAARLGSSKYHEIKRMLRLIDSAPGLVLNENAPVPSTNAGH